MTSRATENLGRDRYCWYCASVTHATLDHPVEEDWRQAMDRQRSIVAALVREVKGYMDDIVSGQTRPGPRLGETSEWITRHASRADLTACVHMLAGMCARADSWEIRRALKEETT